MKLIRLRHSEWSLGEKKNTIQRIKKPVWFSWNRKKYPYISMVFIYKKFDLFDLTMVFQKCVKFNMEETEGKRKSANHY